MAQRTAIGLNQLRPSSQRMQTANKPHLTMTKVVPVAVSGEKKNGATKWRQGNCKSSDGDSMLHDGLRLQLCHLCSWRWPPLLSIYSCRSSAG